jgi:hypothetical protein
MRKSHILIASIAILFLFVGCGKMSPPMPIGIPVLGGIQDLAGEVKDGLLFLSFTMPARDKDGADLSDLAGFKVLKSCGSCMGGFEPFREIVLDDNKGYTIANGRVYLYDDDHMNGFQYSYRVHPVTKRGTVGEPSNIVVITWQTPPDPPRNVTAVGNDGRVDFTWTQDASYSYNVYRFKDNVYPLFPVNKGLLTKPYFMDTGLENGKTYAYEVRAVFEKGGVRREGAGTKVEATPIDKIPPAIPREVKAELKGKGVLITWKKNGEMDLSGYNVYRIGSGKTEKLNKEILSQLFFLDEKPPALRYVSYYVTAVDNAGNESDPSRESIIILKE